MSQVQFYVVDLRWNVVLKTFFRIAKQNVENMGKILESASFFNIHTYINSRLKSFVKRKVVEFQPHGLEIPS